MIGSRSRNKIDNVNVRRSLPVRENAMGNEPVDPSKFTAPISYPWVPDLGDGTFQNPILFADYSDPDVIRGSRRFTSGTATTPVRAGCWTRCAGAAAEVRLARER
jgi:hypothetical protein